VDSLRAALLGLVQGLTEFLPVSSSGHLVIGETILGGRGEGILFEVAVHVGTLLAILVFYRRRIGELVAGVLARDPTHLRYVAKLALATLPAVLVGLTAKDAVEGLFERPALVGVALCVTGAILLTTRRTVQTGHALEPGFWQALWIGCAQVVAIVPGISRSGTTVAAGMALGLAPLVATEFSFLMAVAAISGAAVLAIPDVQQASPEAVRACLVGGAVAALSGLGALWLFVRLLRTRRFHWFAGYAFAAGLAFLAWLGSGGQPGS
jgi:undecaprenyl-diphosphatase